MLSKLTIKNVALIESTELKFGGGLNVLSGETGAGKSVILDSVNFVLGAKADRSMIRYGESECFVKAEFILPEASKAVQTLRDMDVETDGEIIISRKFSDTGKNSIKINGNTVTAAMLRKVTDFLVDVHGQSEHFFLLKEANQMKMLDSVIGEPLTERKTALSSLLNDKKSIKEQMELLGGDEQERSRRLDVLRFQIDEIQSVSLQEGEEEELLAKRVKINNLEKIITAVRDAAYAIHGENGATDGLRAASRSLATIARLDDEYESLRERAENLAFEAEDLSATLCDVADGLFFDESEANEVETRLDAIRALKRKYGVDVAAINEYLESITAEYDLLSDCEGKFAQLTERLHALNAKIYKICREITLLRKEGSLAFCKRVTDELKTLNIAGAQFAVEFDEYTQEDVEKANTNGLDGLRFLFSANTGEPMKELSKIISGGEMSRFMLAVKTQLSGLNEICTYIFDEIDAGISGKTAKVVGEKLARIANSTQIIAVSHLAQIAAMSDDEFLIDKREVNGKTLTNVYPLDEDGKVREIARLLGGDMGDEYAVGHAKELIKQAKEYKNAIN